MSMQAGFRWLEQGSQVDSTTDHFLVLLIQHGEDASSHFEQFLLVAAAGNKTFKFIFQNDYLHPWIGICGGAPRPVRSPHRRWRPWRRRCKAGGRWGRWLAADIPTHDSRIARGEAWLLMVIFKKKLQYEFGFICHIHTWEIKPNKSPKLKSPTVEKS